MDSERCNLGEDSERCNLGEDSERWTVRGATVGGQ